MEDPRFFLDEKKRFCPDDEFFFRSLTAKDFTQDFLHFVVGFFFEIAVVHRSVHGFADHLTHDAHLNSIRLSRLLIPRRSIRILL